jgi:hypothetical protein
MSSRTMSSRTTSSKSIRTALCMSIVAPALAVFVGAGSAAAEDQSPAARHYRSAPYSAPAGIEPELYNFAPGLYGPVIYDYAPGFYAPCFGPNCGLPGGHPRSDYLKNGNGDHGNDGGNGG